MEGYMALLKKTVVLTNNGAVGYVTVVRVGDEVGAKIVGNSFTDDMLVALKIGQSPVIYTKIEGTKTEVNLNSNFSQNDEISCLIIQDTTMIAKAGKLLNKQKLIEYFTEEPLPIIEEVPQKKTNQIKNSAKTENKSSKSHSSEPVQNVKENPQIKNNIEQTIIEPKDPTPTASLDNETEMEFLSRLQSSGNKDFYQNVKERLEDLFIIHPREVELEKIIPDSKWVKIKYDGEDYYVVGTLADNGVVAYLSYGVPGIKDVPPPKLATEISDWLPVENMPSPYQGYWLIFQDATNGRVGNIV
jgi:hypothetical protein